MKSFAKKRGGARLCFVGSMVGRNPGHITQQGQVLSDFFNQAGYPVTSVSKYLNRYVRLADIIRTLIRQRHETDIMVLEVYGGRSFVLEDIASYLGSQFGFRIVMWLHGGSLPEFIKRFPRWSRRVLSRGDAIVTPSDFLRRAVSESGFQARVIPNVIDFPAYSFNQRCNVAPKLFWMRSFQSVWNPEMAVRVLRRLRDTMPDARLVLAGPDKGTLKEVQGLVARLGLRDRVSFPGFLNMEQKVHEAGRTDIFINTNRIDNAPVAVVEACALGLPVVTTSVGGIPDLLTHGLTGLFVPDDDDEAMARAIQELVKKPALAATLSRNGRDLAQRFSWESVRPQWDRVFEELMIAKPQTLRARFAEPVSNARRPKLYATSKTKESF